MIGTYVFYAGVVILWVLGLTFIPELMTVFREYHPYIDENIDTVVGATVLLYFALSLITLGLLL